MPFATIGRTQAKERENGFTLLIVRFEEPCDAGRAKAESGFAGLLVLRAAHLIVLEIFPRRERADAQAASLEPLDHSPESSQAAIVAAPVTFAMFVLPREDEHG